ncbi:uncharacterized protein LOC119331701 isoform X1 [Triticum dicoccoides]|uniref:uncharacterized protein LOC119331701 isoform X1 n=1 Tax=Triticum dicoccoides TaxID=85692 RepID=UPI00188E6885|nr:uncharacterized protein LOC119331701 isoform X1 [Triticum dicoccoides]
MRIRGLAMSGGREVAISAVFTALLVVSILFLPSVLLTSGRLGPSSAKEWPFLTAAKDGGGYPVSFAYLISASTGDAERATRLLAALYHPANSYLLHLDRDAPAEEHRRLAELVSGQPVYGRVGNVWIVGKPNLVTYRGPTMLSTTLHAMAVLLRVGRRWDWFVNLSASDYPLVTQDDLMEAFSRLPRDLNFIQHTSHLGWKIKKRARPVILDTALYQADRSELLRPSPNITTNRRGLPTAFKLFTVIDGRTHVHAQGRRGRCCRGASRSTAWWDGTTWRGRCCSTTPTSSPRRSSTSRRWPATPASSGTPPSTATCISSGGTRRPSSTRSTSAPRTTAGWCSAAPPSPASSGTATSCSTGSTGRSSSADRRPATTTTLITMITPPLALLLGTAGSSSATAGGAPRGRWGCAPTPGNPAGRGPSSPALGQEGSGSFSTRCCPEETSGSSSVGDPPSTTSTWSNSDDPIKCVMYIQKERKGIP